MPTAQQRPPPPPRAERSTGKGRRSRGPQGVQVQGDCQCLHFNSRATPSERSYLHPTTATPPHLHRRVTTQTTHRLTHIRSNRPAETWECVWDFIILFSRRLCFVCVCVFGGCGWFCWWRTGMCFIQSEKSPSGVPRVCVPFVKNIKSRSQRLWNTVKSSCKAWNVKFCTFVSYNICTLCFCKNHR